MPIRSMTGYAQVKGEAPAHGTGAAASAFTLTLKSVNHRFLDLHFRLPAESDALEIKLRRLLKEKLWRGHIDVTLTFEAGGVEAFALNREMVAGYLAIFRRVSQEFGVASEPDLNQILRLPGALSPAGAAMNGNAELEAIVLARTEAAIAQLNAMREEEGGRLQSELRERMARVGKAAAEVEKMRSGIAQALLEKLQARIRELTGTAPDADRLLQEAALAAERSDIQEELVRLCAHAAHFEDLLAAGGEVGKKLDFLLQEMNREANTLLSKTSGLAGEGLRITELGLAMKAEIEKAREQAQNLE